MTTPEAIARVEELDATSTKGPFFTRPATAEGQHWLGLGVYEREQTCGARGDDYMSMSGCLTESTAKLFAEYRTLCPRLARELKAARAALSVAREAIAELKECLADEMTSVRYSLTCAQSDEDSEQSNVYCADQRASAANNKATAALARIDALIK